MKIKSVANIFTVGLVCAASLVGAYSFAGSGPKQLEFSETWCVTKGPNADDLVVLEWEPDAVQLAQSAKGSLPSITVAHLAADEGWNNVVSNPFTIDRTPFLVSPPTMSACPNLQNGWWAAGSFLRDMMWAEVWTSPSLFEGGQLLKGGHVTVRQWGAVALYRLGSHTPWRIQRDLCDVRPLTWKGARYLIGSSVSTDMKFRGIWIAPLEGGGNHLMEEYEPPFGVVFAPSVVLWGGIMITEVSRDSPTASVSDADIVVAALDDGRYALAPLDFFRSTDLQKWEKWTDAPSGLEARKGYAFVRSKGHAVVATEVEHNAVEVWCTLIPGTTWDKATIDGDLPPSAGRGVELIEANSGLLLVYRDASGGVVVRSVTL